MAARRLLDPDVLPRFSRSNRDIAVDEVRASDADQVKVMAIAHASRRDAVKPNAATACLPVIPGVVGDRHQDRLEG